MKHLQKGKERGQSLTEVALMLPVLLLILAGVLDLGRLYYAYVTVSDAAAEGATYAAIHPHDGDEIISRTQAATDGLVQIDANMVGVDCPTIAAGAPVTVTVGYTFTVVTPIINVMVPDGALMLRAAATEAIISGEM
jgi:Flp pilus assembly protein TadG